jgi:pyruvate dehydrogenase E2 component (dihydrolipoamide acetyltransferase)
VDVTRLLGLRDRLKGEGSALTITDFVSVAAAQSLVEMPIVNSRTDGEQLWLRRRVHLGLAVAVPNGLVVIVLRDADHLTIGEIHERAAAMAAAARAGKLGPDDMSGSTFSISNLGMFGVERFSAIINPGESAILAVSSAIRTPVAVGDGIGIRSLMRLTLTCDHRLIDGEIAARFLDDLRQRLERPEPLTSKRLDL